MPLSTDTQAAAAQETADGTLLGRNANSKVGMFGTTPIPRPTVPATGGTVQQVIDALAALGAVQKV